MISKPNGRTHVFVLFIIATLDGEKPRKNAKTTIVKVNLRWQKVVKVKTPRCEGLQSTAERITHATKPFEGAEPGRLLEVWTSNGTLCLVGGVGIVTQMDSTRCQLEYE